jgi:phosphatidylglycerophosphate synthase
LERSSTKSENEKFLYCKELVMFKQKLPNAISSLRLIILPLLIYSFNYQLTLFTYGLFLFAIGTDLADGYIARKLKSTSKKGEYLDFIFDFLFISGMYLNFTITGIYSPIILLIIIGFFSQFIFTNYYLKQTLYDPFGKYYGSLLFGGIGLTLLFSNPLVYKIVTIGIISITLISLVSRIRYIIKKKKDQATNS